MPNKITYTVEKSNTQKTIEYWNPVTQAYQDTNPLTGIPAGTYTGLKARLKGSNPAIIATWDYSVTVIDSASKIALVGIGDSIEKADQATVEAGFATNTGTTSFQSANGATGNAGKQTSTEKAADILTSVLGSNKLDVYTVGYPGKTSFFFKRNKLANFFNTFDFSLYNEVLVVLAFGANDLIYPDIPADSVEPIDIADNIISIATSLKAINPKIKIFISPTLNRTYNNPSPNGPQQAEFQNFDVKRQTLNNSLLTRISSFASGAANIFSQAIGVASMCFSYPNTEVSDGSHPTVKGQGEIGLERARMWARYLNITLPQGNGAEPTPPTIPDPVTEPSATITVTPQSAGNNIQRTATATISNYSGSLTAQLIKQPTAGSNTNINVGNPVTNAPYSVQFTPDEDGYYYYFKLTPSSGSVFYTPIPVLVTISNLTTETATYKDKQNLVEDTQTNTLTAQGVGTNYFSAYANIAKRINKQRLNETVIKFPAFTRPAANYTKGVMIAICVAPVALGQNNFLPYTKYMLYADGTTLRTFKDHAGRIQDIPWATSVGGTVELSIVINPSGKPEGIYFYEGLTQIDYINEFYPDDTYLLTGASDDGVVIPPISISSYGLENY